AGTMGAGVTTLSANRWQVLPTSGAANLSNTLVRLGDAAIASTDQILQSSSAAGVYDGLAVGSNYAAGTPNTLTSGTPVPAGSYTGYLAYGNFVPSCVTPTTVT